MLAGRTRNLVKILEDHNYIRRETSDDKDNRIYYIFLVNQIIAEDLKQQPVEKV